MKKYFLVTIVVALVVIVISCTHKASERIAVTPVNPVDTTHHITDTTATETFDTSVCFQRDVLPIFQTSCAKSGCHDAATRAEGYILDSYAGIIAKGVKPGNGAGSKLYTICRSGEMPQSPTPKLDSTQLSFIKRWIDKGAPNDTNCIANCDTTKYTYATAIKPMIAKYCNACHATSSASSGGGIILDTYAGLQAQALNGNLLGDLQHATGHNAMPQGAAKLSDCKITQVSRWIAAGALNN